RVPGTAAAPGSPSSSASASVPSPGTPTPATSAATHAPGTPTAPATPARPAIACADRVLAAMTEDQRIGQLFMGGLAAARPDPARVGILRDNHVGSIMLTGRSAAGTAATRRIVDAQQAHADRVLGRPVRMLVATDQEGGQVQVLSGPGFSAIPSGLVQGGWSPATLRSRAAVWAGQLRSAGVTLDLAPVSDVVPAALGTRNAPIGRYQREYGHTATAVTSHSTAFAAGFTQSGVMTTLKHFPGLGEVLGNTDTTADVVDSVTTAGSAALAPFRTGIQAGAPFVMISSATYSRIDARHQAVFSPAVINGLLRTGLGFRGVVISDDLGNAAAVHAVGPGQRAVSFLQAGGDMILTVEPRTVPAMVQAVRARMHQDASFRAGVEQSVRRILAVKQRAGLLTCG
uniref:glycoside hydrolase family 3 N-terminal domain-containing protein n=1 Tax=Peterkaempfera griseoplana TaxID=66896 RepID=UPI0006E373C5